MTNDEGMTKSELRKRPSPYPLPKGDAFFACLPLIHLTIGLVMVCGGFSGKQTPPAFVGWLFIILGGGFFLVGQSLAICIIIAGRFLARRKRYLFVFVIACCECLFMPFGTVLGVFTIVLLSRESVKAAFSGAAAAAAPAQ